MARKSGRSVGTRSARADGEFRRTFGELHAAVSAWLDGGDYDPVDIALDSVMSLDTYYVHPEITEDMGRDERVVALGQGLAAAGQMVTRLRRELAGALGFRRELRDQLLAAMTAPRDAPDYLVRLWHQLQAAGANQGDLQPQSHALAKAMLDAARSHNAARRSSPGNVDDEHIQEPVTTWRKLPRTFAGFHLVDINEAESTDFDLCSLPPSTDIAYYTSDKKHPGYGSNRRETYISWSKVLREWAVRQEHKLAEQHAAIWALLLAHRLPDDPSNTEYFYGVELCSPWKAGGIVRIGRRPELDADDVPF